MLRRFIVIMEIPIMLFAACHIVHPNRKFNNTNQHCIQCITTFSPALIADQRKVNDNE